GVRRLPEPLEDKRPRPRIVTHRHERVALEGRYAVVRVLVPLLVDALALFLALLFALLRGGEAHRLRLPVSAIVRPRHRPQAHEERHRGGADPAHFRQSRPLLPRIRARPPRGPASLAGSASCRRRRAARTAWRLLPEVYPELSLFNQL